MLSATIRECFKTDVLLGTIRDPLVPNTNCIEKDISEDSSGSGMACLCTTDFCNNFPPSDDQTSNNKIKIVGIVNPESAAKDNAVEKIEYQEPEGKTTIKSREQSSIMINNSEGGTGRLVDS